MSKENKQALKEEITKLIQKHNASWLEHDVESLFEINQGYCADYADSFMQLASTSDIDHSQLELVGLYNYEDLESQGFHLAPRPSWIEWSGFLELLKSDCFNHTFIRYLDRFYDSECVQGVLSPFDLPIFQRAAKEYGQLPS
ncbi:hypothetical protein VCHA53O466_40452 [Vibrio chagasii]|nr:hypothetical protein VCHA53O466_40452 [Vibrio chagasii]